MRELSTTNTPGSSANTEGDFDRALDYSKKSVEMSPGEGELLDTLAHCYAAKKDFDNAVKYQTRAVELDPGSLQIRRSLDEFRKARIKRKRRKKLSRCRRQGALPAPLRKQAERRTSASLTPVSHENRPLGDVRLAVEDRGSAVARQPVLLLVHGFPLDHTMWQSQTRLLRSLGRVVAPDLRALAAVRTRPGRPPGRDCGSKWRTYADDLNALLDRLEIDRPIVFCGLSMGGYIAWQFCAKYARAHVRPWWFATRVRSPTRRKPPPARMELAKRVLAEGIEPVAAAMLPKFFGPVHGRQAKHRASRKPDSDSSRASPAGVAAALGAMASRPDMTDSLAEIRVPTLVVVGEHDAISPVEEMRGIAERIPGAEFAVIPGGRHMSPLENPASSVGQLPAAGKHVCCAVKQRQPVASSCD